MSVKTRETGLAIEPNRELLDALTRLADRAAELILDIYQTDFRVDRKSDGSPVTEADLGADSLICEGLQELDRTVPIISEEGDAWAHDGLSPAETFWLVDPLDGTRGFTNRNGDFTINIALVRDAAPVAGVVHWPVEGACYAGAKGVPATRRGRDGSMHTIATRNRACGPLTIASSRSRNNPLTREFVEQLEPCEVMHRGSSLKSCLVAEGTADLYPAFSETWYWDTAAPQALLEAAGGALTDLHLVPLRYDLNAGLRNPRFIAYGADPARWKAALPRDALSPWG